MWNRINRMRIQDNKNTKLISTHLEKSVPKPLRFAIFFRFRLENYDSHEKKIVHFIPLDPDPQTQMNADPDPHHCL